MKVMILFPVAVIFCLMATSLGVAAQATGTAEISFTTFVSGSTEPVSEEPAEIIYMVPAGESAQDLETIISTITPISHEVRVRRNIAQATFCLPQNILGILFHGFLQLTGAVVEMGQMNEMTVVITRVPVGASLGKTLFLHTSLQTENAIRHEYGHTMQGYQHGPFFLLFEGAVSFAQAVLSVISPAFADDYFERWPENEANMLGGVH